MAKEITPPEPTRAPLTPVDTPRYILGFTDTQRTFTGPQGEQYYNVNIGFEDWDELYTQIAEEDGGTEIQRWLDFCREQSEGES